MLARLYVEALLADTDPADAIWEVWNAELVSDETAMAMWAVCISAQSFRKRSSRNCCRTRN